MLQIQRIICKDLPRFPGNDIFCWKDEKKNEELPERRWDLLKVHGAVQGGASVVSIWNMCRNNCPAWKGLDTTARTMAKGFLSPNDGFILFHLDFFIGGSDPWHEN